MVEIQHAPLADAAVVREAIPIRVVVRGAVDVELVPPPPAPAAPDEAWAMLLGKIMIPGG